MRYSIGVHLLPNSAKLVLIDAEGRVLNRAETRFEHEAHGPGMTLIRESVFSGIPGLVSGSGAQPEDIAAVGVSSPPGWVFPVDSGGVPLEAGIPEIDSGARGEVKTIQEKCEDLSKSSGYRFDEESALARILWFRRNRPDICRKTRKFLNAADFLSWGLTGSLPATDCSHALGMGFDTVKSRWHKSLSDIGIPRDFLPDVEEPGKTIGSLDRRAAEACGLSPATLVTAASTDRLCLLFASGAASPGQWHSHLGEKLSVSGFSDEIIKDRSGRIYYHGRPGGGWIAGGASCTGTGFMRNFPGAVINELLAGIRETDIVVYPVCHKGSGLLPLVLPETEEFIIGRHDDPAELFSGYAEGVACVERWIFDMLEEMGFRVEGTVFATGETRHEWLRLRAGITGKAFEVAREPAAEFGMAVLALSQTVYGSITEALKAAVRTRVRVEPGGEKRFRKKYRRFRQACRAVGYE